MMRSLQLRLTILIVVVTTITMLVFGMLGHQKLSSELNDAFEQLQTATEARAPMGKVDMASARSHVENSLQNKAGVFAALKRLGEREQALLDDVLPMLALSINILERNAKTRETLDQLQQQRDASGKSTTGDMA